MQRCSHCNAEQLDGAIFCMECGANLLDRSSRNETTTSLGYSSEQDMDFALQATVTPGSGPSGGPMYHNLNLIVINSGRRMAFDAREELLIGRKDNARGIYPDIDLGLDGGYDAGVSRRHALITLQDNACVLEDLESANGTYINGQRLPPRRAVPISNGDEIRFGTLTLRVELT